MYSCTVSVIWVLGGGGWLMPRPGRFSPGNSPVPTVQEAGLAPGQVWTSGKYLAGSGIRSPDCPARSGLLFRLHWSGQPHPL